MSSSQTQAPRRKLLVAVDLSEMSSRVLEAAYEIAASGPRTEVHVLYVHEPIVDPISPYAGAVAWASKDDLDRLQALVRETLERSIRTHGALKIDAVVAHGSMGAPAREIAHFAAQLDADLVVVGTHGRRGLRRALLGSVAEQVVRWSGCPVQVVRPKHHDPTDVVPEVEPLCPDCAQRRFDTKGEQLWCERHSERHPRAHVYGYQSPSTDTARPWGFSS